MSFSKLIKYKYVLASQSPRRKQLLKLLGINFEIFHPSILENYSGEYPITYVKHLAKEKAKAAQEYFKEKIIIAADTIVVLKHKVLEKPSSQEEAKQMLSLLSGKTHIVYTAICVINLYNGKELVDYEKTKVTFKNLLPEEIEDYVKAGTCMDKAGAYGIQDDIGAVFIERIDGCYYNVVGLPLHKLYTMLIKVID